jgi:hypothetical protein
MDREIELLSKIRPRLRLILRRNRKTGCLEYVGKKHGMIAGNPPLCIRHNGKSRQMLLRRWIWMVHNGSLPGNRYIIMGCGNSFCHSLRHMVVSTKYRPYPRNYFSLHPDFPKDNIFLIRYFNGLIPAKLLSRWTKIPIKFIFDIWWNRVFPEIHIPSDYRPPDKFVRQAEIYSVRSDLYHYLGPKNRTFAEKDILSSRLPPRTKAFLTEYISGEYFTDIALRHKLHPSSVNESILRALLRLYKDIGPKKWLIILLKGKVSLS